jgi:hypothetical protein
MPDAVKFECPNCGAKYLVVRVEADDPTHDQEIPCLGCDAPLHGRDGKFVLKYFRTEKSSRERRNGIRYC